MKSLLAIKKSRNREKLPYSPVYRHSTSWTEQERGQPGKLTLQLILDNGVAEYIVEPEAKDADLLLQVLFEQSRVFFDRERKVLIFGTVSTK